MRVRLVYRQRELAGSSVWMNVHSFCISRVIMMNVCASWEGKAVEATGNCPLVICNLVLVF